MAEAEWKAVVDEVQEAWKQASAGFFVEGMSQAQLDTLAHIAVNIRVPAVGESLVESWSRRTAEHQRARSCPSCGENLMTTGLPSLVYSFEVCDCGTPEWSHLVEQLWHASCFQTANPATEDLTEALQEIATMKGREGRKRLGDARYVASMALSHRLGRD